MKKQPNNKTCRTAGPKAAVQILAATFALGAMLACPARADNLNPPTGPGGIQISPVINGTPTVVGSNATINISGLQAPYMIQVSSNGTDWQNGGVTSLKYPNFSGACTATNVPSGVALFRLMMLGSSNWVGKYNPGALGMSNIFVGASQCSGCHGDKVTSWSGTAHAAAYTNATDFPFVSRTVGNGQPGGFTSLAATPQLANVQCENCHGSANAHIKISNRTYHPVNSLSAEVCGSCHTGPLTPTYDEWATSGHAEVVPDVGYGISSGTVHAETVTAVLTNNGVPFTAVLNGYVVTTNGVTNILAGIVNSTNDFAGLGRQMTCGFCHSGATRLAMLNDYELRQKGITNLLTLPDKWVAAETAQTCAVCHDPHGDYNTAQLRNPTRSTNFYSLFTGSSPAITNLYTNVLGQTSMTISYKADGFASQYDPNIQVCAQCHNSRGARWDGLSKVWNAASNTMVLGTTPSFTRGPHHSGQYNILSGILQDDYLNKTTIITHPHNGTGNTNMCATCHVPGYAVSSTTNITGHSFNLDVKGCGLNGCHTTYSLDGLNAKIEELQKNRTNDIARLTAMLNQWATNKGPALFGANYSKYLQNGWEYTTIGALASITNAGPSGSDATKVPDAIKQARFNLYMIVNDGSLGVHNPTYVSLLLAAADTNIVSQYTAANFKATTVAGYAPFTATFTNLGTGISSYNWDFGDNTAADTTANPSHTYASAGKYSVTFTANGGETLTRPSYIQAVIRPTVTFTANQTTVPIGSTVTFTNTSSNISDVGLWRWTFNTAVSAARLDGGFTPTASYTYTNTGTFSVILRGTTPAGNITTTNVAYITVTP